MLRVTLCDIVIGIGKKKSRSRRSKKSDRKSRRDGKSRRGRR